MSITRRTFVAGLTSAVAAVGLGVTSVLTFKKPERHAKQEPDNDLRCVWNMGTSCEGSTAHKLMFDDYLKIPICEGHHNEHMVVTALHDSGMDIEDLLKMSKEERSKLFNDKGLVFTRS
jgi:hypothetical protein